MRRDDEMTEDDDMIMGSISEGREGKVDMLITQRACAKGNYLISGNIQKYMTANHILILMYIRTLYMYSSHCTCLLALENIDT